MAVSTVFWEVTNRCNLSCRSCYNTAFLNDKRYTLSRDDGLRRCGQLIEAKVSRVVFLGGEPLADKNLIEYVTILSRAGVHVALSTNGTLITDAVAERLVSSGVKLVTVSVDGGTAITNDAVRGAGTFHRAIGGLVNLAHATRDDNPRLAVAYTMAVENAGDYGALFEVASSLGIVDVFVNKYVQAPGTTLQFFSPRQFLKQLDRLCQAASRFPGLYLYLPTMPRVVQALKARHGVEAFAKEETCEAVDESVLLGDDDVIYPCSMARVNGAPFRSGTAEPFGEALHSESLRSFLSFRDHVNSSTPAVCADCAFNSWCVKRCVMSTDQTKYYEACQTLTSLGWE